MDPDSFAYHIKRHDFYKDIAGDAEKRFHISHYSKENGALVQTKPKWNFDLKIRNSEAFSAFWEKYLKFARQSSNSIFNCDSSNGIKLITRLRLGLRSLRELKFRHNFQILLIQFAVAGWHQDYYSLPKSLYKLFRWKDETLGQPSKYWRKHLR